MFLVNGLATENTRGIKWRLFRFAEKTTVSLCHWSLFVSKSLQRYAQSVGIAREDQGCVLKEGMCNGLDASRFDPAKVQAYQLANQEVEQAPVIGYVGRLAQDKGIEDLAQPLDVIES